MRLTPVSSVQTVKETQNETLLSGERVRFKVKDGEMKNAEMYNMRRSNGTLFFSKRSNYFHVSERETKNQNAKLA